MNARIFSVATLGGTFGVLAAVYGFAYWLEPLEGDLTRLGSYAERYYGWQGRVQEFDPIPSRFGNYDRPADILVIGDSFADAWPNLQWQNHLAVMTGWSIVTVHLNEEEQSPGDLAKELIRSQLFSKDPPRIVIWSVVERDLPLKIVDAGSTCQFPLHTRVDPLLMQPGGTDYSTKTLERSRLNLNPGFVWQWLWVNAGRELLGYDNTQTVRLKLSRNDLFTSRRPEWLLVWRGDIQRKAGWQEDTYRQIRCGVAELARMFEANGKTRFVTALAPDKSSAYRYYVMNPNMLPKASLPELLEGFPVPDAHLHDAMTAAIAQGIKDVYLPDNTHWGIAGHQITASAVLQMLLDKKLAR